MSQITFSTTNSVTSYQLLIDTFNPETNNDDNPEINNDESRTKVSETIQKKISTALDLNLTSLDLNRSEIEQIPEEIKQLEHLKFLYLVCNKIKDLAPVLLELKKLKQLHLSYNCISEVPPAYHQLFKQLKVTLSHNPIVQSAKAELNIKGSLPPEILRQAISDEKLEDAWKLIKKLRVEFKNDAVAAYEIRAHLQEQRQNISQTPRFSTTNSHPSTLNEVKFLKNFTSNVKN